MQFCTVDYRFQGFVGDVDEHLDTHPIHIMGTWATDAEIFATALMFNTHIYVYCDFNESWQFFSKNGFSKDSVISTENCMYICNVNRNHYIVVTDVE